MGFVGYRENFARGSRGGLSRGEAGEGGVVSLRPPPLGGRLGLLSSVVSLRPQARTLIVSRQSSPATERWQARTSCGCAVMRLSGVPSVPAA